MGSPSPDPAPLSYPRQGTWQVSEGKSPQLFQGSPGAKSTVQAWLSWARCILGASEDSGGHRELKGSCPLVWKRPSEPLPCGRLQRPCSSTKTFKNQHSHLSRAPAPWGAFRCTMAPGPMVVQIQVVSASANRRP